MPRFDGLWKRLVFVVTATAVTVLPEHVKSSSRLQPYVSASAHVLSAYAEVAVSAGLFVRGMVAWVSRFSHGPGWTYLTSQPTLRVNDFFAMGALAYLSFLFRPTTWLILYCFVEGIVRAVEVVISDRPLGLSAVSLGWRVVAQVGRAGRRHHVATLIGPRRPDEIVRPPQSRWGMLEIFSVEEKPWSDNQVVELDDEFYQLATRQVVPHGRHHAWRYQLHRMEASDILRGTIVRLSQSASARAESEGARTEVGASPQPTVSKKARRPSIPVPDR
ncbi:MAG TPA: hypothetical protein PLS53_14905 [Thermoanaerobaculaceae bacterium]|nr:hypothetical protein [Thermoanaerobaculaceae bacterium]